MKKSSIAVAASIVLGVLSGRTAVAADAIMGVNIRGYGTASDRQQDDLIEQLHKSGVTTIRESLPTNIDERFTRFVTHAYKAGIGIVVILYPTQGGTGKHTSAVDPAVGRKWRVPALSDADPEGFRKWFTPQLAALETAGIRVAAFELGNEFNTTGYNADLAAPGSGRVLGLSDLDNPNDAEAHTIAEGYRAYVGILAVLKDMRDHSQLNRTTPVISGGLANVGSPQPRSFNKQLTVSIPDTIEFLRQNGSDRLVDGYGVHVYPNGDIHQTVAARASVLDYDFSACRKIPNLAGSRSGPSTIEISPVPSMTRRGCNLYKPSDVLLSHLLTSGGWPRSSITPGMAILLDSMKTWERSSDAARSPTLVNWP